MTIANGLKSLAKQPDRCARQVFEARFGHYLASHPWAVSVSQEMSRACLKYLRLREKYGQRRISYDLLSKMARPVAFPFSGRVRNIREFMLALKGAGNIREQQCSIWLFFSNVLAEDLVGPEHHPQVYDFATEAGLDAELLGSWVESALRYVKQAKGKQIDIAELDPRIDFMRMDWHSIRQLQMATRQTYSDLHQNRRFWSTITRERFILDGGEFSQAETELQSPLGREFLPWFDSRRFFRPNPDSDFVRAARLLDIPLVTGISGVGMHTFQFARALRIGDTIGTRLTALAYLLPIEQHSYYEVMISELDDAPALPEQISYLHCAPLDWNQVHDRCGTPPSF